ncbi:MAG: hypothetical protein QXT45_05805 [Candidatus Bilamarchaeaceae archaeon]
MKTVLFVSPEGTVTHIHNDELYNGSKKIFDIKYISEVRRISEIKLDEVCKKWYIDFIDKNYKKVFSISYFVRRDDAIAYEINLVNNLLPSLSYCLGLGR